MIPSLAPISIDVILRNGSRRAHATHPGVRVVAVQPRATFPLDLIWRPAAADAPLRPAIETLVDLAVDVAARERWTV